MAFLNPTSGDESFGTDLDWKIETRDGMFLRFQPNTQFDVSHIEYRNIAHIDDLGTRRIYPGGTTRKLPMVPFLGDSFVFGVGVEDDESFPSVVAKEFPRITFVNLGVPGSALNLHLRQVRQRHDELGKPTKYVFFFFVGNDFSDILRSAEGKIDTVATAAGSDSDAAGVAPDHPVQHVARFVNNAVVHNRLLRRSYFIQWTRRLLLQIHNDFRRGSGVPPDAYPLFLIMDRTDDRYYARAQAALEEQVEALARLQRLLDFTSLIIVIPDGYQLIERARSARAEMYGYDQENLDLLRPNRLLESTLQKYGIQYFDATDCLRSFPVAADLYYKSDNHFTKVGNLEFANCVKPALRAFLDQ